MTDIDLKRLKEIAKKATPGPWRIARNGLGQSHGVFYVGGGPIEFSSGGPWDTGNTTAPDAEFVATFDPTTVLKLIELAESHSKRVDVFAKCLQDFMLAFENHGKTTSLKEWNDGMKAVHKRAFSLFNTEG